MGIDLFELPYIGHTQNFAIDLGVLAQVAFLGAGRALHLMYCFD